MTLPLVAFLIAVVIPVFFGKIRSASFWLTLQGAAIAWNATAHDDWSVHTVSVLIEVVLIRVIFAPQMLRRAIHRRGESNYDLMPSNLFTWAIAIALVILAFEFAAPSLGDRQALTLGVVGATVIVSLLLLSTDASPPAQLVAVLFLENALALFESLLPVPWSLPIHVVLSTIYVLIVTVGCWLIGTRDTDDTLILIDDDTTSGREHTG